MSGLPWLRVPLLLAGCAGGADRLADRRGFPGDGEPVGVAPPGCDASCWALDAGFLHQGMAPDLSGGLSAVEVARVGGDVTLSHWDASGALDRSEPLVQGYPYALSGTGDGGFLLVVPSALGEVLGEPLTGSGAMLLKVAADWSVQWSLEVPTNFVQNLHVRGSRVDGGGLLHHVNGGPGGTTDRLDALTRYDADGAVLWEQAAPTLSGLDLADDGDWVATLQDSYYFGTPESVFPEPPAGTVRMGGVMRVGPDGTLRWATTLARDEGMSVNASAGPVVGTEDGGAWIAPAIYEPAGQTSTSRTVWVGQVSSAVPESVDYLWASPITRLDAAGEAVSLEWPTNPSKNPPEGTLTGPYTTTEVYDLALIDGDSALVAGVVLTYGVEPPTSVIPHDGGISVVGGPTMGQTGAYLARFGPDGRGEWVVGHWIEDEFGYGNLETDGAYLFYDALGPDLETASRSGTLLRMPLE
ncbi:MAG: hypothetical protein H6741_26015 [Alphaproteobacteria bacterium]|nr:hypothetical protein [Alphaproteobacteria bacterium]